MSTKNTQVSKPKKKQKQKNKKQNKKPHKTRGVK